MDIIERGDVGLRSHQQIDDQVEENQLQPHKQKNIPIFVVLITFVNCTLMLAV